MMKRLAVELLRLAEHSAEPLLLAEALTAVGVAVLYEGDVAAARTYLEQGIALHRSAQAQTPGLTVGADINREYPSITCFFHMSLAFWALGYPTQAVQQAEQAHRLAEHLGHPFTLVAALNNLAILHLLCGDWRAVQECARAIDALATAQGFRFYQARAMLHMGRALAAQGVLPGLPEVHSRPLVVPCPHKVVG